jgi:hypothetical protein
LPTECVDDDAIERDRLALLLDFCVPPLGADLDFSALEVSNDADDDSAPRCLVERAADDGVEAVA